MNYFHLYKRFGILALALYLSGCGITRPVDPTLERVPEQFSSTPTEESSNKIVWKDFFKDQKLIALVDQAIANNPDRQIAMQRITMAQSNLRIAKGLILPSIELAVEPGIRRFGDHTMDGVGNFDTNFSPNIEESQKMTRDLPDYYVGFRSSWEVLAWGKLRQKRKSAFAQYMAAEEGRHLVTTQLVSEVAKAYYNLLALDNELAIVLESIKLQQRVVEIIDVQRSTGHATELAVKQVNAQLLNTRALEFEIRQQITEQENVINFLLGRFPQPVERGDVILNQELWNKVAVGVPSEVLQKRPDIREAEWKLASARADVHAARKAFYPSLTLTTSVGLQTFNFSKFLNAGSLAYSVFGGLAAPIFKNNQIKAGYEYATASQYAAIYEYHKLVLQAFHEVVNQMAKGENIAATAELKQAEVETLQAAINVSNDLYLVGMASYLEVISAQRSALEAELQLAELKRDQFYVLIDLYRAIGGGW